MPIATIAIILVVIATLVGYSCSNTILKPKLMTYESLLEAIKKSDDVDMSIFGDGYFQDCAEFKIKSKHGYELHARWLGHKNSMKTVVIVHGYTANHAASWRYVELFYSRGYNILMYDNRYHGLSGGETTTLGFFEKYDLSDCINWVEGKLGQGSFIGVHGESMGAATAILTAAFDKRISFVIADCSFCDLNDEVKYQLKIKYKFLASLILLFANIVNKIRMNYMYTDVSPIKALENVDIPILFIHGEKDMFTPTEHTVRMYESYRGKKRLYIAKNAGHAESMHVDKAAYYKAVYDFLSENFDEQGGADELSNSSRFYN